MQDNFEELRSGRPKRARAQKPEPMIVPIEADIAAVALADQPAPEPVHIPAVPADHRQEEPIMATTAETVTETAAPTGAKMFADMNDRVKNAMGRGPALFAEMGELTRGNVEALVESGRVAVRGMERMGQEGADYARRSFETMTANMRALASAKSPTEFVRLQAEQTRAAFDQAVAQTSHTTEAMLKLAGEVAQPIGNRVAIVADRVKTAA